MYFNYFWCLPPFYANTLLSSPIEEPNQVKLEEKEEKPSDNTSIMEKKEKEHKAYVR